MKVPLELMLWNQYISHHDILVIKLPQMVWDDLVLDWILFYNKFFFFWLCFFFNFIQA